MSRTGLIAVLQEARDRAAPDDADVAAELDGHLRALMLGPLHPSSVAILFAPTGPAAGTRAGLRRAGVTGALGLPLPDGPSDRLRAAVATADARDPPARARSAPERLTRRREVWNT